MPARVHPGVIKRTLLNQVARECGDDVWALCRDEEGNIHLAETGQCRPTPEQTRFAGELMEKLNRHADFDGTWAVAWCDPGLRPASSLLLVTSIWMPVPTRLVWMHVDKDGDVNFAIESESSIADLADEGVDARIRDAVEAHAEYKSVKVDVGIRPDQERKAALGQASVDPSIRAVPYVN